MCRSKLVAEILSVGTVRVSGEQPCMIIPPWHPERMKALAVKTRRVAGLVTHVLIGDNVLFGDRGIFFREFSEELTHPFYPEIAVVQRGGAPILVSETSTVNGYSLLERPVRGDEDWRNREKWDAYEQAICDMVDRTSTLIAPWTLVEANDKNFARIKILKTLCNRIESTLKSPPADVSMSASKARGKRRS